MKRWAGVCTFLGSNVNPSRPESVLSQPAAIERVRDLAILHEPRPYPLAAQVLGAQERDPEIDADDARIHPAAGRMEGVREAVAAVDLVAEAAPHLAERGHGAVWREHQRSRRGRGHHAAVDRGIPRRTAPRDVALLAVGRRDPPDVVAVSGKLLRQAETERLVRAGGDNRILEPVDGFWSKPRGSSCFRLYLVASAKIDPGVRILVHEERIGAADVGEPLENHPR